MQIYLIHKDVPFLHYPVEIMRENADERRRKKEKIRIKEE